VEVVETPAVGRPDESQAEYVVVPPGPVTFVRRRWASYVYVLVPEPEPQAPVAVFVFEVRSSTPGITRTSSTKSAVELYCETLVEQAPPFEKFTVTVRTLVIALNEPVARLMIVVPNDVVVMVALVGYVRHAAPPVVGTPPGDVGGVELELPLPPQDKAGAHAIARTSDVGITLKVRCRISAGL
jgi:hypothetical protein